MTLRCLCCCRCATEIRLREDMTRLLTRHGQSVVLGVCSRSLAFGISIFHFRHPTCKFVSKGKNQNEWIPIGFPLCQPPCWRRLTPKREHVYLPLVFLFGFPVSLVSLWFPFVLLVFSFWFPSVFPWHPSSGMRPEALPPSPARPTCARATATSWRCCGASRRGPPRSWGSPRRGTRTANRIGGAGGVGLGGGGFGLSVRCKALSVSRTASTH